MAAFVPLDPGRLRTRFALQQWSTSSDGYGGHTESWTHVTFVWGAIERTRTDERVRAGDAEPVISRTVILRSDPRVEPSMRLVAGAEAFVIRTVQDPDMTGRFLECRVETEPGW